MIYHILKFIEVLRWDSRIFIRYLESMLGGEKHTEWIFSNYTPELCLEIEHAVSALRTNEVAVQWLKHSDELRWYRRACFALYTLG